MKEFHGEGKIYKITSLNDTNKVYIGSTVKKYLSHRLSQHVYDLKRHENNKHGFCSSFDIIRLKNYKIELIELYKCATKKDLIKREKEHILNNKHICVNRIMKN
jgi:hypothetical protein